VNENFTIGAGIDFGYGGDDFDWIDEWNLETSPSTYEVTFMEDGDVDGSRIVELDNPAFYIGTKENGGATIAWIGGKYVWIYQAD
jgi:hypothetical protein